MTTSLMKVAVGERHVAAGYKIARFCKVLENNFGPG